MPCVCTRILFPKQGSHPLGTSVTCSSTRWPSEHLTTKAAAENAAGSPQASEGSFREPPGSRSGPGHLSPRLAQAMPWVGKVSTRLQLPGVWFHLLKGLPCLPPFLWPCLSLSRNTSALLSPVTKFEKQNKLVSTHEKTPFSFLHPVWKDRPLEQWFSTWGGVGGGDSDPRDLLQCLETPLSWLGGCYWHLVDRGQRCCWTARMHRTDPDVKA